MEDIKKRKEGKKDLLMIGYKNNEILFIYMRPKSCFNHKGFIIINILASIDRRE